jgi:hypothetical protein
VVISRRRHIVLHNNNKERCYINDFTFFQFLGETIKKGKKNDHVTAHANMGEVIRIMAIHLFEKYGIIMVRATKWTANCPTQYKCKEGFNFIARYMIIYGIDIAHNFSIKDNFKGTWDAAGS